jgi:hypothetical protein
VGGQKCFPNHPNAQRSSVPNKEIRLDQLTTDATFGEVQLRDISNPLWRPSRVEVDIEIGDQEFRNLHLYTSYRRYRVSANMKPQQ